jgi:hypothetical protein
VVDEIKKVLIDREINISGTSRAIAGIRKDSAGNDTDFLGVIRVDQDNDGIVVNLRVYDPDTLAWVRMTQPGLNIDQADLTVSMGDVEKLLSENYWKQVRYDWTSGNLDYKGFNLLATAAEDATDWYVWKYTWSDSKPTRVQGPLVGTWTGRSGLSW